MSDIISQFHLMRPQWLWLLVPAVVLGLLLWRQRGRSGSWSDVIAPELLPYLVGPGTGLRSNNFVPWILLAWVLACIAASGPSWEKIPQPIHQKQDALVLVLDLSYSMKAADLAPSRLLRARQKLLDLLEQRSEGQTGLIAYAGDAHIVTPLTDDNPTIANLLPALHPDMMPVPGSNPLAALDQAVDLMHSAGISQGKILLITDGLTDTDAEQASKKLARAGMQLAVMGVGTSNGAPIPLPRGGFLKDKAGTIVIPTLDEAPLRALASNSNGRYRAMQLDGSDLDYLLADPVLPQDVTTLALDRTADAWDDQGYWFVLLLLPVALLLFRRGWILCLLPLLFFGQPPPASAQAWDNLWLTPDQQGQRALQSGDPETAATLFENPDWAGTAAYRGQDFESAVEHFEGNESATGWYNRGNALAKAGQIDEAIEAYKQSLSLQPEQADAQDNLALLEQLKQEQEQQEQQQQDDESQESEQEQDQQDQDQQDSSDSESSDSDSERENEQQPGESDDEQSDPSDPGENESDAEEPEEQEQEQPAEPEPEEQESQETQEQQAQAQQSPEDAERDQAMEQWLRRVPDDPSGLLREKFRYESRQRQQNNGRVENESAW